MELGAVALPGDLSREFGGAAPLPLVAAVRMMEPRQALVPLLLLFTLGTSTFGKFKMDLCVDVAHTQKKKKLGFWIFYLSNQSRVRVANPAGDAV